MANRQSAVCHFKSLTNLRFANESARPLANLTICGQRSGRECIFPHSSHSSIHIARKACLWLLWLTGLTSACFRHRRRPPCASSIRNGRPAAPDGLQYSLAHWAYFGLFPQQAAASVRPAKNARNDVHAVISDESLVLPRLCQYSECGRGRCLPASALCVLPIQVVVSTRPTLDSTRRRDLKRGWLHRPE